MLPQAPIVVAWIHERELLAGARRRGTGGSRRFARRATDEERLAAEHALLAAGGSAGGTVARAVLSAAVGMRPFAQERVWFPGFGGPSTRELEDRFGLAAVTFDDVPPAWRPYYRRMLADALTDLQRVLPSLDLRGLSVHFGKSSSKAATLAVHDPRRHDLPPPATGAGRSLTRSPTTWTGRSRCAASASAATTAPIAPPAPAPTARRIPAQADHGDAALPMPGDSVAPIHAQRPAEVFARSLDWFVVVAPAAEGRMNGYLSSVQDDLLTGYGTVLPPDVTGTAGSPSSCIR